MKILVISDTHGYHRELKRLPAADVIVHCGDMTENGNEEEAMDFLEWFLDLPYEHKIFIAGNHDFCLHGTGIEGLPEGCHFLNYCGVTIDGVKFYGVPYSVADYRSGRYHDEIENIPEDVQVLVTHQPPYGILDVCDERHFGDSYLLQKVLCLNPEYHIFGHAHDNPGVMKSNGSTYVNALVPKLIEMV